MNHRIVKISVEDYFLDVPYLGYSDSIALGNFKDITTSCGICCVGMVINHKNGDINFNICKEISDGHKNKGFNKNGWEHEYLLKVLEKNEISNERKEFQSYSEGIKYIHNKLSQDKPVIVSMIKTFLDTTNFHQIIICGHRINDFGEILGLYYHDPASITKESGSFLFMTQKQFISSWRKITIAPINYPAAIRRGMTGSLT